MEVTAFASIKLEMHGWLFSIMKKKTVQFLCCGSIVDLMVDIGRARDDGVDALKFSQGINILLGGVKGQKLN